MEQRSRVRWYFASAAQIDTARARLSQLRAEPVGKRSPPPSDPFVMFILPHVVCGDDLNDPPEHISLEKVADPLHRIQGIRVRQFGHDCLRARRPQIDVGHVGRLGWRWRWRHLQNGDGGFRELQVRRLFNYLL